MAFTFILAMMVNLVVIQGRVDIAAEDSLRAVDSHVHLDVYASAIAKAHYNPWFCNYFKEPGYRCTTCSSALHCFPGNFALLVQCAGRLPYCSKGYCSAVKAERCVEEPSRFKVTPSEHKPTEDQENSKVEIESPNDVTSSASSAQANKEAKRLF